MADAHWLVSGILGMGWLTTAAGWWHARAQHRQEIRDYLRKMRKKLADNPALLEVVELLKEENQAKQDGKKRPKLPQGHDEFSLRNLPAFLEPIGIRLAFEPKAPKDAYTAFAEEVLLCHRSTLLWEGDDYNGKCTYWRDFKTFALETEKRAS